MADEKTDQATEQSVVESKPQSIREAILGWEKNIDSKKEEKKETKPPEPKQTAKAKDGTADDECVGCTEEEKQKKAAEKTKEPYKVLKVDGKDVPVYSEEELIALAQKGFDYTKKTQDVSEQRKEVEAKAGSIEALSEKFNQIWDTMKSDDGISKLTTTEEGAKRSPEEIKQNLFRQLEIDPELADGDTLKIVKHLEKIEESNQSLSKRTEQAESLARIMLLDKSVANLTDIVRKTLEDYPVESVIDENGNNLTNQKIVQTIYAKAQDPNVKKALEAGKTSIPVLAQEAVKELHFLQKTGSKEESKLPKKPTLEQLMEAYPDVLGKFKEQAGEEAVAEYSKDLKETAPASGSARVVVEGKKSDGKTPSSIKDAFNKWEQNKRANA